MPQHADLLLRYALARPEHQTPGQHLPLDEGLQ